MRHPNIEFNFASIDANSVTLPHGQDVQPITLLCVGSWPRFTFLLSAVWQAGVKFGLQADYTFPTMYVNRPLLALPAHCDSTIDDYLDRTYGVNRDIAF